MRRWKINNIREDKLKYKERDVHDKEDEKKAQ